VDIKTTLITSVLISVCDNIAILLLWDKIASWQAQYKDKNSKPNDKIIVFLTATDYITVGFFDGHSLILEWFSTAPF